MNKIYSIFKNRVYTYRRNRRDIIKANEPPVVIKDEMDWGNDLCETDEKVRRQDEHQSEKVPVGTSHPKYQFQITGQEVELNNQHAKDRTLAD